MSALTNVKARRVWGQSLRHFAPIEDSGFGIVIYKTYEGDYATAILHDHAIDVISYHRVLREAIFDAGTRVGYLLAGNRDWDQIFFPPAGSSHQQKGAADE